MNQDSGENNIAQLFFCAQFSGIVRRLEGAESGVIAGTPTTATTASFTVKATDSALATASSVFSLKVASSRDQLGLGGTMIQIR